MDKVQLLPKKRVRRIVAGRYHIHKEDGSCSTVTTAPAGPSLGGTRARLGVGTGLVPALHLSGGHKSRLRDFN